MTYSRRDFMRRTAAAGCAVALGGMTLDTRAQKAGRGKPNLLFVFCDQMRGQAMGFLNKEPVFTPLCWT